MLKLALGRQACCGIGSEEPRPAISECLSALAVEVLHRTTPKPENDNCHFCA